MTRAARLLLEMPPNRTGSDVIKFTSVTRVRGVCKGVDRLEGRSLSCLPTLSVRFSSRTEALADYYAERSDIARECVLSMVE